MKTYRLSLALLLTLSFSLSACKSENTQDAPDKKSKPTAPTAATTQDETMEVKHEDDSEAKGEDAASHEADDEADELSETNDDEADDEGESEGLSWPKEEIDNLIVAYTFGCMADENFEKLSKMSKLPDKQADFCACYGAATANLVKEVIPDFQPVKEIKDAGKDPQPHILKALKDSGRDLEGVTACAASELGLTGGGSKGPPADGEPEGVLLPSG